ncbi:carboxypeptidase-like regulatory domain-containing protein [Segatella baroniae]|uniref:carboxypeptidase-like regulatory domain-containing protein n=1 Tax=Segatella baroniae TaxID=305719 RepID=UPI001EE27C4C|nr:carboxypeptidase-like regulatory domain-containing protein [Segatella baroniae]
MKSLFLLCLSCWMACHAAAQRVTRSYRHAPLSQVLTDLDNASERYTVNFIYNELEDFTVTTDFRNRTIPEAVRDVLGFYPMQLTVGDSLIFVECSQKEPWKVIGRVVDSAGRAVSLANVALLSPVDSAFVNGGVTNDGGDFVIPSTRRQVLLRVSYVGFKTLYRAVSAGHVGTLRLTPDSYMLRNVDVKAVRKVVKSEVDRLQYLVGNDPYAVGMNALELMRRVPCSTWWTKRCRLWARVPRVSCSTATCSIWGMRP